MKNRLVLVVNRRSSGYALVEKKIIRYIDGLNLSEKQRQTYEIEPTNPLDNAKKMAKILQNNDIVLVAGGDGTAHIATNAIIISGKTGIKIKYTGFGNFNDYAHSFSRNHYKACIRALDEQQSIIDYIKSEVSTIDTLISKYQKQIDLMQEYRASLISQAVTGKIDVRDWEPKIKEYSIEKPENLLVAEE